MKRISFSIVPLAVACTAVGQTPGTRPAPTANIVTDTSEVARFVAGPGDRAQGFLLKDGTFVLLPPGLSEQLPSTIAANASISVAGDEFTYHGSRTIQAHRMTLAGLLFEDVRPAAPVPPPPPAPQANGAPGPPPAPPAPPAR